MICFMCKGDMAESTTTHVVNWNNCVIIVKDVPCEKCLQCGESYYSNEVAEQLESIVNSLKSIVTEIAVVSYSNSVA